MSARSILGLDLIRFAAAFLVLVFHLTFWIWQPGVVSTPKLVTDGLSFPLMEPLASVGWIGVQIFFVLSGFVIAYSANQASPLVFLRGRVLRLVPAAWICGTLTMMVLLSHDYPLPNAIRCWLRTVLFWPSGPWVDGVYWTLAIEIAFYGLVLLLLLFNAFKRIDWLAYALATISAVFWLCWAITQAPPLEVLATSRAANLLLVRHGAEFALGVMIWRCHFDRITLPRLAAIVVCLGAGLVEIFAAASEKAMGSDHAISAVTASAVWLVSLAAIVLSIAKNEAAHRILGRHAKLIRAAGLATYPLYLLHQIIGSAIMEAAHRLGLPPYACLAVAVVPILVLSFTLAQVVEPAVRKRLAILIDWLLTFLPPALGQRLLARTSGASSA
jgi:peptidoglycan/LPS O-acetylase OafA/YrhL